MASRNRTRFNPIVDSTVSRTNATNQFAASAKKIISAALQSSNSGNKSASEPSVKAPDQKVLPASVNKAPTERKTSGQRFADVSKPTPTTQLKIELGGRPADTSSNVASKGAGHETKVDRRKLAASRLSSFLLGLGAFFGSGEASGDDENSSGGHTVSSHSAPKAVRQKFSTAQTSVRCDSATEFSDWHSEKSVEESFVQYAAPRANNGAAAHFGS